MKVFFFFFFPFVFFGQVLLANQSATPNFRNIVITNIENIDDEEWNFYIGLNEHYTADIEKILKRSLRREISFSINVPKRVYPDIFCDLEYAVIMIRKYTRYGFLVTNEGDGYYSAYDGLYTFATIDHIYTNQNKDNHLYYIEGEFLGKFKIVGRMFLYIEFYEKNGRTYFKARSFIDIKNLILRKFAKFALKISGFRKRVERMIDGSIRSILSSGFKASYYVHRDKYTYDKYLNNYPILYKRYMVKKNRKRN